MKEKPTIIDFHTHLFPPKIAEKVIANLQSLGGTRAQTDATEAGLLKSMDQNGVDRSVALPVATNVGQVEKLNDISIARTERAAEAASDRLIWFGCMHPAYEEEAGGLSGALNGTLGGSGGGIGSAAVKKELARLKAAGVKGIKIHPAYQRTRLDDLRYLRIMDQCCEAGLFCLTHAGWDIGVPGEWCSPRMCAEIVRRYEFPGLILAHLSGVKEWEDSLKYVAGLPVWLDTAMSFGKLDPLDDRDFPGGTIDLISNELFEDIVRKHGADRILFATDSPWNDQGKSVEQLLSTTLTDEEKTAILGGNAQRLLGL